MHIAVVAVMFAWVLPPRFCTLPAGFSGNTDTYLATLAVVLQVKATIYFVSALVALAANAPFTKLFSLQLVGGGQPTPPVNLSGEPT